MVPRKGFWKTALNFANTLDENLPILGSTKTGEEKTWIDNQVKNAAAKKILRKLCLQNPDNNLFQNDYKAQCKFVRNLIKQKLRHFYQNKIEKEAANSKRSFYNLFNKTSGKMVPAHHNKQIVEDIETFNTFFRKLWSRASKNFWYKAKIRHRN